MMKKLISGLVLLAMLACLVLPAAAAEPTAPPTSLFLNGLANTQASPRKEKAST